VRIIIKTAVHILLEEQGYINNINKERLHHEIYLSDTRKINPEKWKTVIRHPIKKKIKLSGKGRQCHKIMWICIYTICGITRRLYMK